MFELSDQLSMDICSIKCDSMAISKLNTRLHGFHAYQTVYFLFTMAFYDTNLPVGYILHRHDGDLVRLQEQLLDSQVTRSHAYT